MKFSVFQIGFDGGQRQWFIMEIFDQQTNMLQANISSKYPVFTVGGLDAGKLLKIIIYAINVKGRSESVLLEAFTLKTAEKQTGKISFFQFFHFCPFLLSEKPKLIFLLLLLVFLSCLFALFKFRSV